MTGEHWPGPRSAFLDRLRTVKAHLPKQLLLAKQDLEGVLFKLRSMYPLKIQIVVGGRFHANYMAGALAKAGHQVELITSLTRSRFPELSRSQVKSFILPELVSRGLPNWASKTWGTFAKFGFLALERQDI